MLRFEPTMGGIDVKVVNDPKDIRQFGCIDKHGFFTDPVVGPQHFVRVDDADLRQIANVAQAYRLGLDLTDLI